MPRPKRLTEVERLTLDFSPAQREVLENLRTATLSNTYVETLFRATELKLKLLQRLSSGSRLQIREPDGSIIEVIL